MSCGGVFLLCGYVWFLASTANSLGWTLHSPFGCCWTRSKVFSYQICFHEGYASSWPLLMALINVCGGGLKKDW